MVTQPITLRISRAGLTFIGLALSLVGHTATADVVAVVSANSAIATLSKIQLADLFLGRVSRYPNGAHAVPIDQAEGSIARDEFYAKVADKSAAQMKAYWSKIIFTGRGQPPKEVADGAELKRRIAENPDTIGYIDEKSVDDTVRVVR
jgi:ABC-type phosphate transport system substrate-binding protein